MKEITCVNPGGGNPITEDMIFTVGLDAASFKVDVTMQGGAATAQYGLIPITTLATVIGTNWDWVSESLTVDAFNQVRSPHLFLS